MRLSVSNIAWAAEDTDAAYRLMQGFGVKGLEVAPGILFAGYNSPLSASQKECDQVRAHAQSFGLEFTSMQSLLFGAPGVALFETHTARRDLINTMQNVIALAGRLGVPNLVFGSPKNRIIPEGMTHKAARAIWLDKFRQFGDMAASSGVVIALEPNPPAYGANFMVTLEETLEVAQAVDHPAVKVNLDLGGLLLTNEIEKIEEFLAFGPAHYSHAHISVPHLAPVTAVEPAVPRFLAALARSGYENWVSIEMRQNFTALPAAILACQDAETGK